jgi:FkbM family methyltransferase
MLALTDLEAIADDVASANQKRYACRNMFAAISGGASGLEQVKQQGDPAFGAYKATGLVQWILDQTRSASRGWLSERMVFFLRRLAIGKLAGRPVDTEALGARMRLHPYRNVCEKRILFTPQFFDAPELATLKKRITDDFVFLDIGANIGGYTLFVAANAGSNARILAIEPQPDIYARLVYNLRLNDFPMVKALACAVADKDGELTMFVDSANQGESSVKVMTGTSMAGSIQVPATRLLTLIQQEGFTHVDAAKLDTEGAEDLILETFFRESPEKLWPRLIIIERGNNRWHVDLPALLTEKGYLVIEETRNNLIYELGASGASTSA